MRDDQWILWVARRQRKFFYEHFARVGGYRWMRRRHVSHGYASVSRRDFRTGFRIVMRQRTLNKGEPAA